MRLKRPTVYDLNVLGVSFYQSRAYDLAIVQFKEALRLAPELPSLHFNLGGAYYGKGRLSDAEREFRATLDVAPDHVGAHWFRGICLARLGRLTDALQEFEWVVGHSIGTREARTAREEIAIIRVKQSRQQDASP